MTTEPIRAPWTADQATALNAFQHYGRMHPFTCGALHESGQSPILVATHSGWTCPDPQCTFRQDWAHAFMIERGAAAVPAPPPADRAALLAEAIARVEDPEERAKTTTGLGLGWEAARDVLRRMAAEEQPAETLCRCGHGRDRHAPDVYGTGTCADCPGDEERSWRHPYTPTERPAVGEQPAVPAETHTTETPATE
ncbi:hypothetical protein [Streptomyces sp. A012304]|uniref:hypothetical protein n=1 Tax=Streptomyces sp. A012304 TaxID=375446 RepID=UPI002230C2A3|nr:hypothetical protein [Streptomyces sp. A012304]GKQ35154.1 hypothetical protein ALMP_17000 [Streptomyces sp. A012304]